MVFFINTYFEVDDYLVVSVLFIPNFSLLVKTLYIYILYSNIKNSPSVNDFNLRNTKMIFRVWLCFKLGGLTALFSFLLVTQNLVTRTLKQTIVQCILRYNRTDSILPNFQSLYILWPVFNRLNREGTMGGGWDPSI